MKKKIILLFLVFGMTISLFSNIIVKNPGPYYPGVAIGFNKTCHKLHYSINTYWDWGDGTSKTTHNYDNNYGWQYHSFAKPGTYTVTYYHGDLLKPAPIIDCSPQTETFNITIMENRYITVSPSTSYAGQLLTFTAVNFITPDSIKWDMGDGTILNTNSSVVKKGVKKLSGNKIQYTYLNPGNYTVRAYDENGKQNVPISLSVKILKPNRQIKYNPKYNVRVDQPVSFQTTGFLTNIIDWNMGDGTVTPKGGITITHRYQTAGIKTVTAKDSAINHASVQKQILILPENRSIVPTAPVVKFGYPIQVKALNFRSRFILWNFGDGTYESAGHLVSHMYNKTGTYIIKARDENGKSLKKFTTTVIIKGITDEVSLEVVEIKFDDGKYYKVVPKNSKDIKAVLRMKMRGTGAVSGYWIVDGNPFEFFNEIAVQGELKEIFTRAIPGLPTLDPGIHTISVKLTKPSRVTVKFPVIKYFVSSTEAAESN